MNIFDKSRRRMNLASLLSFVLTMSYLLPLPQSSAEANETSDQMSVPFEVLVGDEDPFFEGVPFTTNLNLVCPGAHKTKQITCTIEPVVTPDQWSDYTGYAVTGSIDVYICLYDWRFHIENYCADQIGDDPDYDAVYRNLVEDLPLNTVSKITFPSWPSNYFWLEVQAPGGSDWSNAWEQVLPQKKNLTVKVSGTKTVRYGQTTKFTVTANPKISATCKIYRFNGGYTQVATVKLNRGRGSGSHRWLWRDWRNATAITLTAICETTKHRGVGYLLVSAYP